MGRQVQRSLSARCQLVLVGKLRPPREHDGQCGRRSKRKRLRPLEAAILHNGPGRLAEAGFGVGGEESLVSLAEAVGTQAVTKPTDCESVENWSFRELLRKSDVPVVCQVGTCDFSRPHVPQLG